MSKQKNIPQLRFKGFGAEWEFEKLQSRIKTIDSGWSPQCEEYPSTDDEWGVLKTTSVVWEGFNENANKKLPEKLNPRPELQVSINDILITRAGPTSRVGVTVHVNKVRPRLMLSDKLIRLRSNENCSSLFLAISLSNSSSQKQLVSKSSGLAESQTNISQKILLNTKLSFPTLPEQQKIASFLSAVDEKIQQLYRKKELLAQYKKGVMQQLFSGKLRFKDENGKDYADWEEKKLGDVCEIVGGGTPDTNIPEYWGGEIQWFTPTEIKSDFVSYSMRTITELGLQKSSAKKLPIGTILLTTRATIGEVSIAREECSTNQGFQSLIARKGNSNIFIFNWIKQNKHELTSRANGSTFPEISKTAIEKIFLNTPSFPEQQKIANFLSNIDTKIEATNQQINQTQSFKKGLLQQLFV